MKKIIILLILIITIGCEKDIKYKNIISTNKIYVRQLVNTNYKESNANFNHFFIISSGTYNETYKDYLKAFVLTEKGYTLLKVELKDINIIINDSIDKPYFIYSKTKDLIYKKSDSILESYSNIKYITRYSSVCCGENLTLYTSEKYLPEKLLPIKL